MIQSALQYKLTQTARRCIRGGARSCIVRTAIQQVTELYFKRDFIHTLCVETLSRALNNYPFYCSAPCTYLHVMRM